VAAGAGQRGPPWVAPPGPGAWWPAHRPALVAVAGLAGLAGVKAGPTVLAVLVLGVTTGLVVWWRSHPGTFHPWAGRVLLGLRSSGWAYGVRWRTAMMPSGLGAGSTAPSTCPGWCGCGPAGTWTGSRSG
jgi:hypothetical protein